jgi:1,4-dihydroxy-2-naphthoyl-CoA hydrolase
LAETVASVAAMLTLDPKVSAAVGLEINANHVRPASGDFVHAEARAEYIGRTTQIWSFRLTDAADRLVCLGRITVAIIPQTSARPIGQP